MSPIALAQVVHHAEVNDRADPADAKDVLRLAATHVDLVMHDVVGLALEATTVDTDHRHLPMQSTREQLTHASADARDHHRTEIGIRTARIALRALRNGPRERVRYRVRNRSHLGARCTSAGSFVGGAWFRLVGQGGSNRV
jgi:hypothetical protein